MKGPERRAEKNRERIVQVALEMFKEQGIRKVSVGDIARKAGFSPATIYNQFGNKETLVREAIKFWYSSVLKDYKRMISTGASFEEKFQNLLSFKSDTARNMHGEFALKSSSDDPEIRSFLEQGYMAEITKSVFDFFEEGRNQGYINPDLSTESIIRYAEIIRKGLDAEAEMVTDPEYTTKLLQELTPIVLYGILGKQPES